MFLNISLELILIAILFLGAYYGLRYGFIKIVAKPIEAVLRVLLSLSLCSFVGENIFAPLIQPSVTNYIKEHLYNKCSDLSAEAALEELPTLLKIGAAVFNVELESLSSLSSAEILEILAERLTSPAVILISVAAAFVILLFVFKYSIRFITILINFVFDGGVLGKINRMLGVVLAGALSFFAAWTFVSVLDFLFHAPIFDTSDAIRTFEGGPLYRLFNMISPIELLLSF